MKPRRDSRAPRKPSGRRQAADRFKSPEEIRSEITRRTFVVVGRDLQRAPLVAAAIASLLAQGRPGFREREILAEAERLAGELRGRYGFSEEAAERARLAWEQIAEAARRAGAMSESSYGSWLEPLEGAGVAGSTLYVTGPERCLEWFERRYRALAESALERLELDGIERIRVLEHTSPRTENTPPSNTGGSTQ